MSDDATSVEQLWKERYRELEDTFAMAVTAIAESVGRQAGPGVADGVQHIWTEVSSSSRVVVVATLSGPPQEVSFRVTTGDVVLQDGQFNPSNTLSFQSPTSGRYLVTCTSRLRGSGVVLGQKSVEVIVG